MKPNARTLSLFAAAGMAASAYAQPTVVNGASHLIATAFDDAGIHARSAVGVSVLPLDAPVEVELIVEID